MPRYLTNLAGLSFRPAEAKILVKSLRPGAKLKLQREPDNPFDPNAIMVLAPTAEDAFEFIGYVEKLTNGPLAPDLDDGFDYAATVANTYDDYAEPVRAGNWARPLIEIITSAAKNTVRV